MPAARPAVVPSEALLIRRARQLLGADAVGLTDAEVLEAYSRADAMAHVIVRMFIESRQQEPRP